MNAVRRLGQHREILLHPGEYFVGDERCRVSTLLGSCVSITLWHPRLKIGAMSHFVVATRPCEQIADLDARYGDEAVLLMLEKLVERQVVPRQCEARIFGGGNMFPNQRRTASMHVGQKNGESAKRLLESLNIHIASENLFGVGHRKIVFDMCNGTVASQQHLFRHADRHAR